ncbi:HDOD domain-containing protein [Massilia sp. 2TAF26]|uniref:HDOD domain-containing protein n=1 Tax=Massilia sp. 2TAF26 TaxID=3233012 RepID=UPI003F9644D8
MVDIAQVVKRVRDLPTLPSIALDLISSFEREDVDVTTLAEKISRDQALAAKTLRLANSSFYGLAAKVRTVKQAIVVLGFDSARVLAVASSVIETFGDSKCQQIDVAGFWRHSIAAALCAKSLARHAGLDQDCAFIAGLLHDIGRLVLASSFPDEYAQVLAYCERNDTTTSEAELCILGVDHQRVGEMLAEIWKFPPLIQRAIGQHHAPAGADLCNVPGLVHAANALVQALDLGGGAHIAVPRLNDATWESLRLTPDHLQAVCRETEGQFEEASRLFMQG